MAATTPAAPGTARAGTFTRVTVTIVMAVIASLAFVFSFGNVWALALRLGVPHPIAPLIAPMVDLSVVGLLVALHHLVLTGTEPGQLRSATRLMHLCGALTLALNTAEPVIAGHYGRACLDTVAPALLLGWGAVGPDLLRHLATTTPNPNKGLEPDTINPLAPTPAPPTPPADQPTPAPEPAASPADTAPPTPAAEPPVEPEPAPDLQPEPVATPAPAAEPPAPAPPVLTDAPAPAPAALPDVPAPLLGAARRIADDHRARTGDVITPGELRARLGVPPRLADAVHAHLAAVPA